MKKAMTKEELKELRAETELSQEDFSLRLGVKTTRYRAWEYGHNGIDPLIENHIRNIHKEIMDSKNK